MVLNSVMEKRGGVLVSLLNFTGINLMCKHTRQRDSISVSGDGERSFISNFIAYIKRKRKAQESNRVLHTGRKKFVDSLSRRHLSLMFVLL